MTKRIIILTMAVLAVAEMSAQQDAMFTHYMHNTLAVNPAYAGSRDAMTTTLLHRNQWVSIEGAPKTNTLTIHSPVFRENLGFGFSVVNERVGPINNTALTLDFAYSLQVTKDAKLGFGLKAGANMMSGNLTELAIGEEQDVAFEQNMSSDVLPNFGFGLYYHSDRYYVGLSTPKIIENDFRNMASHDGGQKRHYFLIAGTVVDLSENIRFKPTTFLKITQGAPLQADLTSTFIFNDKFNLGAMYRTDDAIGALLGVNINPQLYFGYSFDWAYRSDWNVVENAVQRTSHEVMLRYDMIFKGEDKIRSSRFF